MLFKSFAPLLRSSYLHHPVTSIQCVSILSSNPTPCLLSIPSSCLSTSPLLSAAAGAKSDLAKLRKKTGYSLSICKKALGECDQDLAKAEKWLVDQAQAQGWAKAQKLQGRNTSQGLLGVKIKSNVAAVVELNCETDFVARNGKFVSLLDDIATQCVQAVVADPDHQVGKSRVTKEQVEAIKVEEGKTLADLVALNIGQIGENISVGGVTVLKAGPGVKLSGLSHPSSGSSDLERLQFGRHTAILAYTHHEGGILPEGITDAGLARQLCQHIIGMAPSSIEDEDDKENSLLHQTFLLDEDVKVGQVVKTSGLDITDFVRSEVGRSDSD